LGKEGDGEAKKGGGLEMGRIRPAIFRIENARRIVQFLCFLLFNAAIFGLGPWPLFLPVLQSLGVPQKTVGDAFAALQLMLYNGVFPWLPLASIFLATITTGRSLCGWACPFGFVQDLLKYIKRKQTEVSLRTHETMIKVKHGILLLTLFISGSLAVSVVSGVGKDYVKALGAFAPAPFEVLSPANTFFAILPRVTFDIRNTFFMILEAPEPILIGILSLSPLFWLRITIMVIILALGVYVQRSWCMYLCPEGALLALLNRFSFLGLKRDPLKCIRAECRACVEACPMKVRILDLHWEKFTDPECIYCLKCVSACSTKALRLKFL